jgi:hypothetical protein
VLAGFAHQRDLMWQVMSQRTLEGVSKYSILKHKNINGGKENAKDL